MSKQNYAILNLDITIVCESPKIKNYSTDMRKNIARICEIEIDQVNIKGTTSEGLGFIGREEGIAAIATILLKKNE